LTVVSFCTEICSFNSRRIAVNLLHHSTHYKHLLDPKIPTATSTAPSFHYFFFFTDRHCNSLAVFISDPSHSAF
jgi:hypothetical protein